PDARGATPLEDPGGYLSSRGSGAVQMSSRGTTESLSARSVLFREDLLGDGRQVFRLRVWLPLTFPSAPVAGPTVALEQKRRSDLCQSTHYGGASAEESRKPPHR